MSRITKLGNLIKTNGNLYKIGAFSGSKNAKSGLKKSLLALAVIAAATGCVTSPDAKSQSNGEFITRYFQQVDSKKPETLAGLEAPGVTFRLPLGVMDGAGHAQVLKAFAGAFPNFQHKVTRCVEAGEWVSCEGTFTGDHTGPLAMADGSVLPATNKHVEFTTALYARVQNGKLVEFDAYFDVLGFLGQLGVGPGAKK